jgi:hypothetical protein
MSDIITSRTIHPSSSITLYIKFLVQQCRITDVRNLTQYTVPKLGGANIVVTAIHRSSL